MKKVPFRVSARAARLIGRENVATAQGAITELVKNSYDADATACAIFFMRRHESVPTSLTKSEFRELSAVSTVAKAHFVVDGDKWTIKPDLSDAELTDLNKIFDGVVDLWILDDGRGMSPEIIEERWMVIGTDHKERESTSDGGRVLTGAKGIGRFALDRLGQECELLSSQEGATDVLHWVVDWGDFEGEGKIIDDVTAILEVEEGSFSEALKKRGLSELLPEERPIRDEEFTPVSFDYGTAIGMSILHDVWDQRDSQKLRESLEALLPPKDRGDFGIFIYDQRNIEDSGWIDNFAPDQYDFRMHASINDDGLVDIRIDRQEIDVTRITPTAFTLEPMTKPGFTKEDLELGFRSYKKELSDLVPLEKWESANDLRAIGPFEFTLYFFRLSNASATNLERLPQKSFDATKRRNWLKNSGGIRLYRDLFRVRPYGDPNTQSSDWLLLGQRTGQNPAAVSRLDWRVGAAQVAGTIHISKSANPMLGDQSNREGIMNERSFALFRRIIIALVSEFEKDRSYLYHQFVNAYEIDNPDDGKLDLGKKIAKKVLQDAKGSENEGDEDEDNADTDDLFSSKGDATGTDKAGADEDDKKSRPLAEALDISERVNTQLKDEIQVLRGMATLGTVLVSFTHELKQIKANMGSRQTRMEKALDRVVDEDRLGALAKPLSPYDLLDRWGREDEKVGRWVDFALSSVSPKKRRKRPIEWGKYLEELKSYWSEFMASRNIDFDIPKGISFDIKVLAHEIDLDSIFYNLIINSFEAFDVPSPAQESRIVIEFSESGESVELIYHDNGPGVSDTFNVADDIFLYGSTSKRESEQDDVTGTGIGMWLTKSIVDDSKGDIRLLSKMGEPGFKIAIKLPKYEKP